MASTIEPALPAQGAPPGPPHAPAPARDPFRPTGRVLATLNEDGTRRWLDPKLSPGRFWSSRRALAYGLILLFAALPFTRVDGRPAFLLDVVERRFTLFGTTFFATDTLFLMLAGVALVVGVFLLTALFGRVWCGWGCPQTVYMEFLFRPIERLIEGDAVERRRREKAGAGRWRRALKALVFLALSFFVANVFLAYFVGTDALARWVTRPPWEHPAGFAIVAVTTLLMLADFGLLREQVCLVACPYGRFQSVLLDRESLIVAYDYGRGEPRGKPGGKAARADASGHPVTDRPLGDCVDCNACVATCPTGIDIRDGLQMECIHCTQCIDACDAIMDRVGKPRGLVRYSSQDRLAGKVASILRPRIVIYPLILTGVLLLLGFALAARTPAEVTLLRGIGAPYLVMDDGEVSNQLRVKVRNRTEQARRYLISVTGPSSVRIVAPQNPLPVPGGKVVEATLFVLARPADFVAGKCAIVVKVADVEGAAGDASIVMPYGLLGPTETKR